MTGYAPYPLVPDAAAFDLATTTFSAALGTTVARHLAHRGSDRATIMLHGAAGSFTTWTPVLRAARNAGISIPEPVLLDLPGWGDAELLESVDARTIDIVCELVRDAAVGLGYTQWDIVGHSMGGFIALHMASIWPSTVVSVSLVSPTAWSVIESVEHPVRRLGVLPGFTLLWQVMRALGGLGAAGRSFVRGLNRAGLLRPAVFPLFRHGSRVDRSVIDSLALEVRPGSFVAAAEIARGYDANGMWRTISCPVRALKGDRDIFVRHEDFERLRDILPRFEATVVADCGHFANVEHPDAVLALIIR